MSAATQCQDNKKRRSLHCVWTKDAETSWTVHFCLFAFTCCLMRYLVVSLLTFSVMSAKDTLENLATTWKKKNESINIHVRDHCCRHHLTVPDPEAQRCACLFLHRPLVAGERSYQKNAVSISSKLFPLSSLSQYWARPFVLFSITTVMHQSSLGSRVAFSTATLSWSGPPRVLCHKKSVFDALIIDFFLCCFGWVHFTF